jgi:hypothetical protein
MGDDSLVRGMTISLDPRPGAWPPMVPAVAARRRLGERAANDADLIHSG